MTRGVRKPRTERVTGEIGGRPFPPGFAVVSLAGPAAERTVEPWQVS